MFEPLRDPDRFSKVYLDEKMGTVASPNGADFAPEALYELTKRRWRSAALPPYVRLFRLLLPFHVKHHCMQLANSRRTYWLSALLAALLTMVTTFSARGQGVDFGVKGGITVMTNGGSDAVNGLGYRTGFLAGGFASVDVPGPFALRPEVMYLQKGASANQGSTTLIRKLEYVEIPVLLEFQPSVATSISTRFFTGPSIGFNVVAEQEVNGLETYDPANVRTTEVGLQFGTGVDFELSAGILGFDVRYELGLNSIEELSGDFVRNQGVLVTTGFTF